MAEDLEQSGGGASGGQSSGGGGGQGSGGGSGDKPNPVPNPNIMLRKGAQPMAVDGEVNIGMRKNPILFPSKEVQGAGWYHPRADEIIKAFGDRYIAVKPLGE